MADSKKPNFFEDNASVDENEEEDVVTLFNERTQKDEDFYHLATLEHDAKWYIVMKPVQKIEDIADDEVLIYEIVEDENGEDMFAAIEDEKVLDAVFNDFMHQVDAYVEDEKNKAVADKESK